jgi:zeta-carotene desaturase
MSSTKVIVIGGGLAGLSSAVALAEAGFHVRLFESRPHLGGRATSYFLPDGNHVDNCQHVTMRCCTNLEDFYRRVGVAEKIRFYDELLFVDRRGRRGKIKCGWLPAPFHFAGSFAAFPSLRWSDKRRIALAMWKVIRDGAAGVPSGVSMLDWLRQQRQTPAAIERFWRVVLVSALNEKLENTEARYGVEVFSKGFLANRLGFAVGIPCVPLAQLYDGSRAAIESRGGEVTVRAAVREIVIDDGRAQGVALNAGADASAEFVISAVPHEALLKLLPEAVAHSEPVFRQLRRLGSSPITGVHFWFDRAVMDEPFLTVLDRTTQWIFNKSRLFDAAQGGRGPEAGQYLQLVISASYELVARSRQEIIDLCLGEAREILPRARDAHLVRAAVVKETQATFSPVPGCDQWRPKAQSPLRGLYLAGDWTATGWPATMESAVRSGYLAAEAILRECGQPRRLVCDDLPVSGLSAWLRRK